MSVSININKHHVGPVKAERHPNVYELVTVTVEDDRTGTHQGLDVVAVEAIWQIIADRLAALGIVGKVAESETYAFDDTLAGARKAAAR